MTTNTGGPAFPCDLTMYDQEVVDEFQGMTLRDHFAGLAMQGLLAAPEMEDKYVDEEGYEMGTENGSEGTWYPHTKFFAASCYTIADEMLKARQA